jgi:hypothetical protein
LVFEKSANFFADNCRRSQKIVIITSTPGHPDRHLQRPVGEPLVDHGAVHEAAEEEKVLLLSVRSLKKMRPSKSENASNLI